MTGALPFGHPSTEAMVEAAREGNRRALARLITIVETGGPGADSLVQSLHHFAGRGHVVGVTGSPGTGKSTLVAALAREIRSEGQTVAIVAVDPSSPFTGGALLGDRVRMGALAGDAGVFVRSMASRGAGGGLAAQTIAAATVLDACGFEVILVETVGAGQDELAIAGEAHTTVVVTAPGAGDEIQALKAGILEIGDILVVNKADSGGANRLVAALTFGRGQQRHPSGTLDVEGNVNDWTVPVMETVAITGKGVPDVVSALRRHRAWLEACGSPGPRARALAERRILRWAAARAVERAAIRARGAGDWGHLVDEVAAGRLAPSAAADALLDGPAGYSRGEHPGQGVSS